MISPVKPGPRRGAVAPLVAVLLVPLVAMVAFAVDMAWVVETENELQSVADAAALAGANALISDSTSQNGYVQYYLAGQATQATILSNAQANARAAAKACAKANSAGGVSNLALNDSDIEFGFTDSSGAYTALPTYTGFPNTVKLIMRRDGTANGSLKLFFAPVIGTPSMDLTAKAAGTIYTGAVDSFQSVVTKPFRILPMTYDVNHWNSFLQTGKGPDGTTDTSVNGAPQLQVYPSIKFTGNFGLLSLDQGNDGASTIRDWINNGVSSLDLQQEFNARLLPLSAHPANTWDWKGNPGLKMSDVHAVADNIGKVYLLPLFQPVDPSQSSYAAGTGNGSHYNYDIVQFVAVTITQVDSGVHVQPTAYIDPNIVLSASSITPAAPPTASAPLTTTFAPPKLTQ